MGLDTADATALPTATARAPVPSQGRGAWPTGVARGLLMGSAMRPCLFLVALAIPAASACTAVDIADRGGAVETIDGWDDAALDIYFIPGGGAAEDRLAAEVAAARREIRVAMYNITSARLGHALIDARRRGVAVEVLWDAKQMAQDYNTLDDELTAAGLVITPVTNRAAAFSTVHDKLAIIDGERVTLGSANWGTSALYDNNESLLVFESVAMAAVVDAQLDEIRDQVKVRRAGDLAGPVQLHFSPEDRLDRVVQAAIDSAHDRVYVAVFSLRLRNLTDALIRAHGRGVRVFVATDRKQSIGSNEDERLRAAGVPVVEALNATGAFTAMHHKFAVVDDTVLVGAYNWTYAATFQNDEDLAVIRDPEVAAAFAGEMGRVWRRYGAHRRCRFQRSS